MRSRIHSALAVLAVCGHAACSSPSEEPPTNGEGGAGGSSVSGVATASGSGGEVSASTGRSGPSSTSGGSVCGEPIFEDPDYQACLEENCCSDLAACAAEPASCFGADGALDIALDDGRALYACSSRALCFSQGTLCGSGIAFGDGDRPPIADTIDFAYCLDQSCCEELTDCTAGGTDACIDCLDGDAESYELCQAASDCAEASCDQALIFAEYCDSGIGTSSGELGLCGSAACCTEWNACSGGTDADGAPLDPERAEACLACLDGDGVGICEAVDACMDESCSTEVCDSGFVVRSLDLAACLTESCCEAWNTCTTNGTDVDACDECLASEDGGPLCDAAIECYEENCAD